MKFYFCGVSYCMQFAFLTDMLRVTIKAFVFYYHFIVAVERDAVNGLWPSNAVR